ncbi:MAG TPA: LacI family DNA-binding transcriptional regulator [Atribacteraceae bacterium]|nr:LacI family DNA-binding transcriptional regulator [Atribacteraceae bacterium]
MKVTGQTNKLKPTLQDVAREANTSIASVSRVINNSDFVRDEIRQRVWKAIERLQYFPNTTARSLARGKTVFSNTNQYVGVLFGQFVRSDHSFFSSIISGIEKTMFDNRINIVLSSMPSRENGALCDLPPFLAEDSLRYIILIGEGGGGLLRYLQTNDFIFVVVDALAPSGVDCVLCDYKRGSVEAMEYLFDLGHSRIGLILGPKTHYFSRALEYGYRKVHENRGIQVNSTHIVYGNDFSAHSGFQGADRLFSLLPVPTAVFTNDEMAIGVLKKAKALGVRAPEDVSLFGFDDIGVASFLSPPLTTMRIPSQEMGNLAARLLLEHMKETVPSPTRRIEVSPLLVPRESCRNLSPSLPGQMDDRA